MILHFWKLSGCAVPTISFSICLFLKKRAFKSLKTLGKCCSKRNHRNAELYGTYKDHWVEFLALHKTPQESHQVPKRVVQMLLELWQAWCCDHFHGKLFQCPAILWVKNLFLISGLNLPDLAFHLLMLHRNGIIFYVYRNNVPFLNEVRLNSVWTKHHVGDVRKKTYNSTPSSGSSLLSMNW